MVVVFWTCAVGIVMEITAVVIVIVGGGGFAGRWKEIAFLNVFAISEIILNVFLHFLLRVDVLNLLNLVH